ncbi:MAG: VPLPA-CTERM sorting domain-containing protein [Nitrospira sp.]|nr:MAG: VPLPA-CTERM sorting domain-containing protein [Nitrospira sp.]
MNLDADAWAGLAGGSPSPGFEALVLDEFFDQAAATSRTGAQILADEIVANPSTTGLTYGVNGSTVTNLAGRSAQPTAFTFDSSDLTGTATGQIGLGGVMRFDVNPLLGGGDLLIGDFTLAYDATRIQGSGWFLKNNIGFPLAAFDTTNVNTTTGPNAFSLLGNLTVSPEFGGLFLAPTDIGKVVGTFSFQTPAPVPLPAAVWLFGSGLIGLVGIARRRMKRLA